MSAGPPGAEVVGSLLRSQRLRAARDEHAAGDLDDAAFKRIEDDEVDRASPCTNRRAWRW